MDEVCPEKGPGIMVDHPVLVDTKGPKAGYSSEDTKAGDGGDVGVQEVRLVERRLEEVLC